ncbi:MAG: hypothetical protein WD766_12940 [Gemmatimonadota bacterium]
MALFGHDYDEHYRTGAHSNREGWDRYGRPPRQNHGDYYGAYGGRNQGWGGSDRSEGDRYDRGFRPTGYDRGYKSQWETDYGDPFGDRQQHTPMRVIRGEARGYDAGYRTHDTDRSFRGNRYPMGYQPYSARAGYDRGFRTDRPARPHGGYDQGWF